MKATTVASTLLAVLGFLLTTGAAHATALTFNIAGTGDFQAIDQAYGDNVTATTMGSFSYGSAQGFTPDITVAYGPSSPRLWTTDFGDLTNVLISDGDGKLLTLILTAAPGFNVSLHSFDLAGWTPGFGSDPTLNSVTVFDGANDVLFSQANPSISITTRTPFTFATPLVSQVLRIQIDALNIDSDDIGIDNVTFGQTGSREVPDSCSTLLLLLTGICFLTRGGYAKAESGSIRIARP